MNVENSLGCFIFLTNSVRLLEVFSTICIVTYVAIEAFSKNVLLPLLQKHLIRETRFPLFFRGNGPKIVLQHFRFLKK